MSDKKEEHYSIYTIPYNFIDESKVFGGMISTRKLVEGCILGAFFSFPFFLFSLPIQIKLTLILVFFLVFGIIGCIGINGDPISRFIIYYIKFRKQKRLISFNGKVKFHESEADDVTFTELPRDKVLKLFVGMGSAREESPDYKEDENYVFDDDIVSEQSRQDIISKLFGKKKYAECVSDNVPEAAEIENYLYSSLDEDENVSDDILENIEDDSSQLKFAVEFKCDVEQQALNNVEHDELAEFLAESEFEEESELCVLGADNDIQSDILSYREQEFIENPNHDQFQNDSLIEDDITATGENLSEYIDISDIMLEVISGTEEWQCKFCKTINDGKFCEECGSPKEKAVS